MRTMWAAGVPTSIWPTGRQDRWPVRVMRFSSPSRTCRRWPSDTLRSIARSSRDSARTTAATLLEPWWNAIPPREHVVADGSAPTRDIFIVCNSLNELGGLVQWAHDIAKLFLARGHRVQLIGVEPAT